MSRSYGHSEFFVNITGRITASLEYRLVTSHDCNILHDAKVICSTSLRQLEGFFNGIQDEIKRHLTTMLHMPSNLGIGHSARTRLSSSREDLHAQIRHPVMADKDRGGRVAIPDCCVTRHPSVLSSCSMVCVYFVLLHQYHWTFDSPMELNAWRKRQRL